MICYSKYDSWTVNACGLSFCWDRGQPIVVVAGSTQKVLMYPVPWSRLSATVRADFDPMLTPDYHYLVQPF